MSPGSAALRSAQGLAIPTAVCLHLMFAALPAARELRLTRGTGDYPSYYYALHEAWDGGDPYDVQALGVRARADGARRTAQPYFYPPAFLLTQVWALPLSLQRATWVMYGINEAALGVCLWFLLRLGVGVAPVALMLASFTPIAENLRMGQANLLALALALGALTHPRLAAGIGVAAMLKMSPAILLLEAVVRRQWRMLGGGMFGAAVLAVASLLLVPLPQQARFYFEVLPGFAQGDYHGLQIPVVFPGNHSLVELFARLWPDGDPTRVSSRALLGGRLVSGMLLVHWWRRAQAVDRARSIGALMVLMTLLPTYTWEHHLVFLLLPMGVLLTTRPAVGLVVYGLLAELASEAKTVGAALLYLALLHPTRARASWWWPAGRRGSPPRTGPTSAPP